jgi:hypothetical protein
MQLPMAMGHYNKGQHSTIPQSSSSERQPLKRPEHVFVAVLFEFDTELGLCNNPSRGYKG